MKNRFNKILLPYTFIPLYLILGCNPHSYNKEIAIVEGLNHEVDEVEKKIAQVDSSKYAIIADEMDKNLDFIDYHFQDTMNIDVARYLSEYAGIKKSLKEFKAQKRLMNNEITLSRAQLKALHHDLEKNAVPLDSINSYITTETKAVEVLKESITKAAENVLNNLERYDSLNTKVMEMVQKLKIEN